MIRREIAFGARDAASRMAGGATRMAGGATPARLRHAGLLERDMDRGRRRLRPAVVPLQCRGPAPARHLSRQPRDSRNVFSTTR
jgi:hypothetical protein